MKSLKSTLVVTALACLATLSAQAANAPKDNIQQQIQVCQKNYATAIQKGDVVQASKEAQKIAHLRMSAKGAQQPLTVSANRNR